jgi:hypothetical protein
MMRRTIAILAFFTLASGSTAQGQEVVSRKLPIRKDHPRILFNKDQLPAIRAKCEGPFAKEYAQMQAQADERVGKILPEKRDAAIDADHAYPRSGERSLRQPASSLRSPAYPWVAGPARVSSFHRESCAKRVDAPTCGLPLQRGAKR